MNGLLPLNLQILGLLVLVLLIALLTASETALLTYKRLHASSRKERLNYLLAHTDQVITLLPSTTLQSVTGMRVAAITDKCNRTDWCRCADTHSITHSTTHSSSSDKST